MEAYRVLSTDHLRAIYDGQIRVESILKGQFEEYEDLDMLRRNQRNAANDSERYAESGRPYESGRYVISTPRKKKPDPFQIFGNSEDDFFVPILGFAFLCIVIV